MGLMIEDPWIREAPPGAAASAGYMKIKNHSDKDRALVGASSPQFGNVMLHRTVTEGGVAKMVHQMSILVPAKGEVVFEPNGYHLMLMKPKATPKAGDKIEITLKFQDGETMKVVYEVRAGMPMKGMPPMNHGDMAH